MRIGPESIGRWGVALLTVTALAGVALGAHGWASRHAASVPHTFGSQPGAARQAASQQSSPSRSSAAAGQPAPSAHPSASATAAPGPLLKSMPYAQYAYQIYPGKLSAAARQALAGVTVTIHRKGAGISLTTAVNGGPTSSPHLYPSADHVYIVEAALGDDSGATDYNLGDDSLVVTDAQGRMVQ